jgi:hypothetical protein
MEKHPNPYQKRKDAQRNTERALIDFMDNALGINTRWRRIQAPLYPKSRQCTLNLTHIARVYGSLQAKALKARRKHELDLKFAGQRQYFIEAKQINIHLILQEA